MIALLFSFSLAMAQQADDFGVIFDWKASGALTLGVQVKAGQLVRFPGLSLRDAAGETVEGDAEGLHAIVTSYGPFLSLVYGKPNGEASLVLLERTNGIVEPISNPIPGRLAEMPGQLKFVIKQYAENQKSDPKDVSGLFRTMVGYFDRFPNKQLADFADEVERRTDAATLVQKPASRVADAPAPAPAPRQAPAAPPVQQQRRVVQQQPPRQRNPYDYPPQQQARRAPPGYYQQQPQQQSRGPIQDFFGGMFD